jgi:hypothetical protein
MVPGGLDPRFTAALLLLHGRLEGSGVRWAVMGSVSHALRGLDIHPRDIDVFTDEEGAHEIERLMGEYVSRRVSFSREGRIRSHFGELTIGGVKVEIIGDMEFRPEGGGWRPFLDEDQIQFIELEGAEIPVRSLEQEVEANLRLGRPERADRLRALIDKQPSGDDLGTEHDER